MTEKRYIVESDCLCHDILDTWFGSDGVSKPTEQEIIDKDYLTVCDVYPLSVANELCERLNRYEEENKELKAEIRLIEKNHDDFYDKVFALIDKKIAEYNEYYETQIEDQSYSEANAMKECVIALQVLKKELQE